NIFAIGDPDQSIYGFRGSDVQLFFRFSEDFGAKEMVLQHNYRSAAAIVAAAAAVISNNTHRSQTKLVAMRK
ncbi:MAG TPA: UvrD-helicase domain-containing protein, partial [Niabella sp.]